ncbi:MAG: glycosyltransferase family 2 protein [Gemmatimonadales bacterium]
MTAGPASDLVYKTVVVVPAHQEEAAVGQTVAGLRRWGWRVIVVDDGSTDRTSGVAVQAGAVVLRHAINLGQGAALRTGITYALAWAETEYIVTFDADGQHDPADVERLVAPLAGGLAEVALGSRFLRPGDTYAIPGFRRRLLPLMASISRLRSGLRITDVHNGLRAFRRDAIRRMRLRQDRMAHASEIHREIARLSLRHVEVPVRVLYTPYSVSKGQRLTNAVNILWDLLAAKLR